MPASLALIPVGLVNDAGPSSRLAPVNQSSSDTALEEARTAITGQNAVVLAGAGVPTHDAEKAALLLLLLLLLLFAHDAR